MAIHSRTQLIKQLDALLTDDQLIDLIQTQRNAVQAAIKEKEDLERIAAIESIRSCLQVADKALREAGDIGDSFRIDFTFVTPKNRTEDYRAGWQSSDCYASDGWYSPGYEREISTIDGFNVDLGNEQWYSSSTDC